MNIELWAGFECTVNRVGNRYHDQIKRTGHEHRFDDLDHIAELGVRCLRYPVLWERTAPDGVPDWRWPDHRLAHLQRLGITPIIGLLHHGSGPHFTNLLDPEFAHKFCDYALSVARRFPWVEAYTPINEPLTTARFSCLYGHWYPHRRDTNAFARALLNQCKAIVLAMNAIRTVNPNAALIQTEDFGKIFSTPELTYQSDFENCRRWTTWDLLNGAIDRAHPMHSFFLWAGIPEKELRWFQENPCSPDILGINHYVTSDRYLDANLDRYPSHCWGGNGRQAYADVEAVRVLHSHDLGPEARLREVWQRYHAPIAVTEAHLGCAENIQQLKWFREAWEAASSQKSKGADIRAVTSWALLGAFDWNSLLTRENNDYERGAFELHNGAIKPTPLSRFLRELARGAASHISDPAQHEHGWWRRPERIHYPVLSETEELTDSGQPSHV